MVTKASTSTSLKDYLKKYESSAEEEKKKKMKKKVKPAATPTGVLVVDEDPVWQKPVKLEEEEDNDSPDEKPQVDEDIEVKRMKRLELIRARRSHNQISEDGSGWVSVSEVPKCSTSLDPSSDISPPRIRKARYDTPSPETEKRISPSGRDVGDLSPPRQRRQRNDSPSPGPRDIENAREQNSRRVHTSPSPQHKAKSLNATEEVEDLSPPRKRGRRYDSLSPEPRSNASGAGRNNDLSPPRRQRRSGGSPSVVPNATEEVVDLSPPRKRGRRYDSPSPEPRSNASGAGRNNDHSPPRRQRRSGGSPSSVPERRHSVSGVKDSNLEDLSPPRRFRPSSPKINDSQGTEDLSPPRKSRKDFDKPQQMSREPDLSPPRKSKEDRKTGLITGKDVREEIAKIKKDEWSRFNAMDPSTSGRGAEPVYRIKGERVSKEEYLKLTKKEEKPKEDKKLEWGKGLAQKREAEEKILELEAEKSKPFARTRDDPELDSMMKNRLRWGDPMAHLVKNKQSDLVLPDLGDSEKMKESGFIVPQEIPSHSWLKRRLDCEPNRYGIKPGRHWDGVNRSNGFEKQMFKRTNEKKATEQEAYLWSVSDM